MNCGAKPVVLGFDAVNVLLVKPCAAIEGAPDELPSIAALGIFDETRCMHRIVSVKAFVLDVRRLDIMAVDGNDSVMPLHDASPSALIVCSRSVDDLFGNPNP